MTPSTNPIALRLIGVLLALGAASTASSHAQTGATVLSIDDGRQVKSIARVVNGRWIAETWCTPGEPPSATTDRERVIVSGGLRIGAVRAVVPGSPEWLRLTPKITDLFERREREERLSDRTANGPRAVDWIYAAEDGDRGTYYFEASRRVSNVSADVDHDIDPPGTLRIVVAGFLRNAPDRLPVLGTKTELRWEQDGLSAGPSRADLTPLGTLAHGGRSLWVMKGQSGSSLWFTLYDVSGQGTSTVLTTRGVRC